MSKIILTESKLQQIIAETIKKTLNEISSDILYAAQDKAQRTGRYKQSSNFNLGAIRKQQEELNANDKITIMRREFISFTGDGANNGLHYRLNNEGMYWGPNNKSYNLAKTNVDRMNITDKQTARIIANWANKYLKQEVKEKNPKLTDWHFWAKL